MPWGLGAFAIGLLLFDRWDLELAVGVIFGVANWFLWRPNGPAHRWRAWLFRRFPPS